MTDRRWFPPRRASERDKAAIGRRRLHRNCSFHDEDQLLEFEDPASRLSVTDDWKMGDVFLLALRAL